MVMSGPAMRAQTEHRRTNRVGIRLIDMGIDINQVSCRLLVSPLTTTEWLPPRRSAVGPRAT